MYRIIPFQEAIIILEGLGQSLDPNLDILSKASCVLLGEALCR